MRFVPSSLVLGSLMLVNCGSEPVKVPVDPPAEDLLAAPKAGEGVQYKMLSHIQAGQEIERCQLVMAPAGGLFIRKDEVRFTAGSHHVLLYQTPYTSMPTRNRHGDEVNGAEVHDCADGAIDAWKVTGVVAGSQSRDGDSIVGELPEGVAIKIAPGAVLLMNTHYLNASSEAVDADARINLYTLPEEQVKTEAGVMFFYNPFIRVPANGKASAQMRCPVAHDISVVRVQSHMHRRGVGFLATRGDAAGAGQEEIYTSHTWEQVPAKGFQPLLDVKAGESLEYRCDYTNTEARDVTQGLTTRDEMCMLIGPYFPRDPAFENCADDQFEPAGTWTGSGKADGATTLGCFASAKPSDDDGGDELYGCVIDSCPGVANEVSEVLRCQMSNGHGACAAACSEDGGDCGACVNMACGPAFGACQAAKCD
jgi:copper type II ascorbate-dependent monooxygenase-like protein